MVTVRSFFVVALLSAVVVLGFGCSGNEPPKQAAETNQEHQQAMSQENAQPQAMNQEGQANNEPVQATGDKSSMGMPKTVAISGTVEKAGDGIVIVTDLGKYNVIGQDLSGMIGKTVNVTGAVEESGGQYTINVLSVSEK